MELPVLWEQIRVLRRCAWDMMLLSQDIRRILRLLEGAWQGGDADTFQIHGQYVLSELELLAQELDLFTRLLQQETEKWEQTDWQGAKRFAQFRREPSWKEGKRHIST